MPFRSPPRGRGTAAAARRGGGPHPRRRGLGLGRRVGAGEGRSARGRHGVVTRPGRVARYDSTVFVRSEQGQARQPEHLRALGHPAEAPRAHSRAAGERSVAPRNRPRRGAVRCSAVRRGAVRCSAVRCGNGNGNGNIHRVRIARTPGTAPDTAVAAMAAARHPITMRVTLPASPVRTSITACPRHRHQAQPPPLRPIPLAAARQRPYAPKCDVASEKEPSAERHVAHSRAPGPHRVRRAGSHGLAPAAHDDTDVRREACHGTERRRAVRAQGRGADHQRTSGSSGLRQETSRASGCQRAPRGTG